MASNLAELVDLMHYWLHSEYAKWITDPEDPQVKAEADRRKRAGIKPPPMPLIMPVAHRPPSLAEQYRKQYEQLVSQYGDRPDAPLDPHNLPKGKHWVSSELFDMALGI
jgi:hypothetical protein